MPTFPPNPSPDQTTEDGKYIWKDPPGVWKLVSNSSAFPGGISFTSSHLAAIEQTQAEISAVSSHLSSLSTGLSALRSQITAVADSELDIDLSKGVYIHVPGSTGPWSPNFINVPSGGIEVYVSVYVTANDYAMDISGTGIWKKGTTAPVTGDWDANELMMFRAVKMPNVNEWVWEWLYEAVAPPVTPDPVTPPTLSATYSTSASHTSPLNLQGATLPNQAVSIRFNPADTNIVSKRIFCNHTGPLPAKGQEGDTFVGTLLGAPWYMLGIVSGNAIMWDQSDPTGNARVTYDNNGTTTLTDESTLIDGQVVTQTYTFTTGILPVGSSPNVTRTSVGYGNATIGTSVSIPDGVDRFVLVEAHYTVDSSLQTMTGLSLGGTAMINIPNATRNPADFQGLGVYSAYLILSDGPATSLQLTPGYNPNASPAGWSAIVYHITVGTNVKTPTWVAQTDYENVGELIPTSHTPTVTAPANAYLFTSASSQTISVSATVNIGTMTNPVEVPSAPSLESRSAIVTDSGAAGSKTATWSMTGRSVSVLIAMGYTASTGGGGVTPITPGIPVVSLTKPADNQLRASWAPTSNAQSYEIRWGTSNPPSGTVVTNVTSPHTITGLAALTQVWVQVRARSSTGTPSDWSAAVSDIPTGTVTPPPTFSGKYLTSTDHRDVQAGEGYGTPNFNDFWTQKGWVRVQASRTEWDIANIVRATTVNRAIGNWNGRNSTPGAARAFRNEAGPRLFITSHMGINGARQDSNATAADKAEAIYQMGVSGSTGSINRDSVWRTLGDALNATYDNNLRGYEVVHYSISHENFGSWAYDYAGRNTQLIGQPKLTGATDAQFGGNKPDGSPGMGAALRYAGETGDCSLVHKLCAEHIWDVIQSRCGGKAILGMSPNDGEGSSLTGLEASSLGSKWIRGAFPDRPLDFIAATKYLRGANKMTFNGGDQNNPANWTCNDGMMEYATDVVNNLYGCPFGLLELGGNYAVPTGPYDAGASTGTPRTIATPGDYESQSDQEMYIFFRKVVEEMLPQFTNGLTVIQWWNFLDWVGSNHENGCSFNIFEGMWGWHPGKNTVAGTTIDIGYLPTSTGKPYWSTVAANTRYPKTLAWFQSQFAVGVV